MFIRALAINADLAAISGNQAHYHVKTRGFACPIGAEQADDFASGDFKRDISHHGARFIFFTQVMRREHGAVMGILVMGALASIAAIRAGIGEALSRLFRGHAASLSLDSVGSSSAGSLLGSLRM